MSLARPPVYLMSVFDPTQKSLDATNETKEGANLSLEYSLTPFLDLPALAQALPSRLLRNHQVQRFASTVSHPPIVRRLSLLFDFLVVELCNPFSTSREISSASFPVSCCLGIQVSEAQLTCSISARRLWGRRWGVWMLIMTNLGIGSAVGVECLDLGHWVLVYSLCGSRR
jgi:hypothetical protein